jgi:hypothetical protein
MVGILPSFLEPAGESFGSSFDLRTLGMLPVIKLFGEAAGL